MKRPKWLVLVGSLAIFIGFWGMMGHGLSLVSTLLVSMDTQRVDTESLPPSHEEVIPRSNEESNMNEDVSKSETLNRVSPWPFRMTSWFTFFEIIAFMIASAYLLAGIFLLTKPYGVKSFYYVLAASLLLAVMKVAFFSQGQWTFWFMIAPMVTPSIIIDLLLGAIVFTGTRLQSSEQPFKTDKSLLSYISLIWLKPLHVGIPAVSGALAALFALMIPVWVLGMPGVDNNYATGWKMGFEVICWYPIGWILLFGLSWALKRFLRDQHHHNLAIGTAIGFSLFFVLALVRLGQSFHFMSI